MDKIHKFFEWYLTKEPEMDAVLIGGLCLIVVGLIFLGIVLIMIQRNRTMSKNESDSESSIDSNDEHLSSEVLSAIASPIVEEYEDDDSSAIISPIEHTDDDDTQSDLSSNDSQSSYDSGSSSSGD